MGWYIIFGCIALGVVIFVLVGIIQEIHDNNKSYKKEMDRYNSDEKYGMWNEKPQKRKMKDLAIKIVLSALSVEIGRASCRERV